MNFKMESLNPLLDLFTYKVFECKEIDCKKDFSCVGYHNENDKRRKFYKNNIYHPKKCKHKFIKNNLYMECNCKGKCICEKLFCKFSHNNYEILYHPMKYKTQICKHIENLDGCIYGIYCCNSHSLEKLKIELIHKFQYNKEFFMHKFKTEFCPIIKYHDEKYKEIHIKKSCVYAHNFQDYRRKIHDTYLNENCKEWNKLNTIPDIYTEKCKYDCNKFHGWKEFDYHPKNYKIVKCNNQNCESKFLCPKYHNEEDKNTNIIGNSFLVNVPKKKYFNK